MTSADQPSSLPFGLSRETVTIWALVMGVLYALEPVFEILFMTYIMSYAAHRAVTLLTGNRADRIWFRQTIVVVVYLATLAAGFLVAQSVIPRAIEQGKWLLSQVSSMSLERMRDELLARTVGRFEFARFRLGAEYPAALKEYATTQHKVTGFQEARRMAREIRQSFEESLAELESELALEQLRKSGELDDLYRAWLRANRAERELAANEPLRQRLADEYDSSFAVVYGEPAFARDKSTAAYLEKRAGAILDRVTAQLAATGRDRANAERALARARARDRLKTLSPREMEERFRGYFHNEVPRRFPTFGYSHEKLLLLEQANSEADFRARLVQESAEEGTVEERFKAWMEMKLARESRLSQLLGDTSDALRATLPRVTGWLTSIINNALSFGFDALVSLMFSFMVVWEIPQLRQSLERIRGTRAERIYDEIAPGLRRLGTAVAAAFSAQAVIATIDACLVFAVLTYLGLPSAVFLSMIVLVCCLIPYVGMLIAALPVLFVALQQGGPSLGLHTAIALFLVHEFDAWLLSPAIMGEFLRLSPMAVIFVLFVSQPIFGLWGLLLGVPIAVFLLNEVLLRPVSGGGGGGE
ncbi:MAG: AI-2E family transporter [Candidatus Wallbacteria bacterium]|nr:AI-2E family transporter [Candidatus Wallbacteria bacterium]